MFKLLLFSILSLNLFALELSITGAKEDFSDYSTLHLKDESPFLCEETKDEFDRVTKIVCAFTKRPPRELRELQNSFFKIQNTTQKETFFFIITPFEQMKLYPIIFDVTKDKALYQADVKLSKHWMIVGYKEKMPFIKKEPTTDTSINFPFELDKDVMPYVGSLDIKGNPVHIKKVGDVTNYLKIKKLYAEKKYDKCLETINEVIEEYPNSLFNAELLFYEIRVFAKLEDHDNVIEISKTYLQNYSSDENIPEVLSLIAYSYYKVGLSSDADYFFDRLFSEHESSEFAKLGYIYVGEMFESSGGTSKAISYYEKAMNETQSVETASMAAYKLAKLYVMDEKTQEASKYIMKIVNAMPEYFIRDLSTSMDMMYVFGDNESYETAAAIAKCIIDVIDKEHDEHENLMKERAMWLTQTADKQKALQAINDYIKEYEFGAYEDMIQVAKDQLFFDTSDGNFSQKLQEYNSLIEEYPNDSIGDRAIYEKAKLLLENENYVDVMDMKEPLLKLNEEQYKDTNDIIKNAAIGSMKIALENKQCQEVLNISNDYNITLSNEWDDGVYECSMVGADFILAKSIAQRNLKSEDLELRKKWLYRYIKVDFETGNYTNIVEACKELRTLIQEDAESPYQDVYRILFDVYQRVGEDGKLIESITDIEKIFGEDYKDIERYVTMMSLGSDLKDDNLVVKYGEEVLRIQKRSSSFAQSPFVEFTLFQTYLNLEEFEKAIDVMKLLDNAPLNNSDRARQKYLLGTVYSKLWREDKATKAYDEAIQADPTSPWAKLAESAKKL